MIEAYTAEMARKDVAATERIRREQEEKKWNQAVDSAINMHLKHIYDEIKKRACRGVQSYDYDIYGVDCDEFYISAEILCRPVMEHLFNAGYTVDYQEVEDDDGHLYELYVSW